MLRRSADTALGRSTVQRSAISAIWCTASPRRAWSVQPISRSGALYLRCSASLALRLGYTPVLIRFGDRGPRSSASGFQCSDCPAFLMFHRTGAPTLGLQRLTTRLAAQALGFWRLRHSVTSAHGQSSTRLLRELGNYGACPALRLVTPVFASIATVSGAWRSATLALDASSGFSARRFRSLQRSAPSALHRFGSSAIPAAWISWRSPHPLKLVRSNAWHQLLAPSRTAPLFGRSNPLPIS